MLRRWKQFLAGLAIFTAVTCGVAGAPPLAPRAALAAPTQAYIVVDAATGEVRAAQNAEVQVPPASLTKLMTLYMLFEALDQGKVTFEQQLPVSAHAASMSPTKLGVRAGDSISVADAIPALIVKSYNDVAVVVGEALGGSEAAFATLMTAKAKELGMARSRFVNASGLPDKGLKQVVTARDMALLARALMVHFPHYYPYFHTTAINVGGQEMPSHNRLMLRYAGMDGLKTGYINASGYNLAASAVRGGHRLIGVIFGGASPSRRDKDLEALLDTAFASYGIAPDPNARQLAPMVAQVSTTRGGARLLAAMPAAGLQTVAASATDKSAAALNARSLRQSPTLTAAASARAMPRATPDYGQESAQAVDNGVLPPMDPNDPIALAAAQAAQALAARGGLPPEARPVPRFVRAEPTVARASSRYAASNRAERAGKSKAKAKPAVARAKAKSSPKAKGKSVAASQTAKVAKAKPSRNTAKAKAKASTAAKGKAATVKASAKPAKAKASVKKPAAAKASAKPAKAKAQKRG